MQDLEWCVRCDIEGGDDQDDVRRDQDDLKHVDDNDDAKRLARVEKALREVEFAQRLLGPHDSAEQTLAIEVRRWQLIDTRAAVMAASWREVATEQRAQAKYWRAQGEAFAWHAIRADDRADLLETQATLLLSLFWTKP